MGDQEIQEAWQQLQESRKLSEAYKKCDAELFYSLEFIMCLT